MNQQHFSDKLQSLRKNKGYTQQQLATKLHVTNKAISKWENKRGFPDITLLPQLSKILGVTIDELLSEYHAIEKKKRKHRIMKEMIAIVMAMVLMYVVTGFFNTGKVFTLQDLQGDVFIENKEYPGVNCTINIPSQQTLERIELQLTLEEESELETTLQTTGGDYLLNRRYDAKIQKALLLDTWQKYNPKQDYQKIKSSKNVQSMVIRLQQRQLVESKKVNVKNSCTIYFTKFNEGYLVDMLSYKENLQRSHIGSDAYIIDTDTFEKIKTNLILQ